MVQALRWLPAVGHISKDLKFFLLDYCGSFENIF